MPAMDIMRMPYRWIPETWKPANYLRALAGNDGSWMYLRNILNSVIVSTTIAASTVLLSSHLLHEIEVIADDLVVIGNGAIVASGTKDDLLAAAAPGLDGVFRLPIY